METQSQNFRKLGFLGFFRSYTLPESDIESIFDGYQCGDSIIKKGDGAEDIALTRSGHVLITSGLSWPVLNHNPREGRMFSLDTNSPLSTLQPVKVRGKREHKIPFKTTD